MKPKSGHRYRVCGTPVRTGCITCKIRRVKCDEGKPFCKRCTSTGRNCDGYGPVKKPEPAVPKSPPKYLSLKPTGDPIEDRILHFFSTFTAPKLSGNFSPDFWERRVLQASNFEPSIRHGVIAIGAIHQDFQSKYQNNGRPYDPSIQAFAFRQYTMAISHLHRLMSTQTQQLDITLISCILFICFDCLLGNHASAIIHLKAGLQILEDIKMQNAHGAASAYVWEREFAPLLLGLGVQASSFVNPKFRQDRSALWSSLKNAGIPTHPTTFRTLDEARHALDTISAEIMTDRTATSDRITEKRLPNPHGPEGRRHRALLQGWDEVLDRFLADFVTRETREVAVNKARWGASLLKVHSLVISVVINIPDPSEQRFERILVLCSFLISTKTTCGCPTQDLNFSADMGVIAPLFFTALRAPTLSMQRRALDLLSRTPGREGMWDAEDALRVAGAAVTDAEQRGDRGTASLPDHSPHNEARVWDEIAMRLQCRMTWPFGQKEEVTMEQAISFEQGTPFTRSSPDSGFTLPSWEIFE